MPELTFGFFVWAVFTFLCSCWNAGVIGAFWSEKSRLPISLQLVLWAGAIMAVCGFFAVYLFPVTWGMVNLHLFELYSNTFKLGLEPQQIPGLVNAVFQIAYTLMIVPVLGSGYVIMVHSWVVAYQRKSFGNVAVAAWNTYANISNTANAFRLLPEVGKGLSKFFIHKDGVKRGLLALALLPIAISLGGALVTTWAIMQMTDAKFQLDEVAAR